MNEKPIMACGCVANATKRMADGTEVPACVIHDETLLMAEAPNLEGRIARCAYCGKEKPSSRGLPFFEFLGEGSPEAKDMCTCGYHRKAHEMDNERRLTHPFKARGPAKFDRYYCGCRGWD